MLVTIAYALVRASRFRVPGWLAVEALLLAGTAATGDEDAVGWLAAHRRAPLDAAEIATTDLGGVIMLVAGLGAVTAYVCRRTRSWRPFWLALTGLGGAQVLVGVAKFVIRRQRPAIGGHVVTATGYSFPSGHSASAVVGFGLIAWLLCAVTASRTLWATAWTAAALGALAVGASRVYLGVHYPSDVLAGWLLGAVWLGAVMAAAGARRPASLLR